MEDTWTNRELPVCKRSWPPLKIPASSGYESGCGQAVRAPRAGCPVGAARPLGSLAAVYRGRAPARTDDFRVHIFGVTERARRAVGQWPTPENLVARLVEGFNAAADQETNPKQEAVATSSRPGGRQHAVWPPRSSQK